MQVNGLLDHNTNNVPVYCPTVRNDKEGYLKSHVIGYRQIPGLHKVHNLLAEHN